MNQPYREVYKMKIKRTATAILLAAASLSIYAGDMIALWAAKPSPDYDAWIKTGRAASAEERLKSAAFPPTDATMFLPQVYPSYLPVHPAAAPIMRVTSQQLRNQVNKISGPSGLKVMDDPAVQAVTQDLRLRAALATTVDDIQGGTVEPVKRGVYSSIAFGHPPAGDGVAAQVVDDGTGHFKIIVNEDYQHEDIRLLGILLGHEALHQDADLSVREELMAHIFQILAHAQHVIKDPRLASQGTELARFFNTVAMGLLNTRRSDGLIHLLEGRGEDIWPASNSSVDYLAQNFVGAGLGVDTIGNDALLYSMRKLTGDKELEEAHFNDDALALLEEHVNTLLSPKDWIALAEALKLDTGG